MARMKYRLLETDSGKRKRKKKAKCDLFEGNTPLSLHGNRSEHILQCWHYHSVFGLPYKPNKAKESTMP